MPPAFEGSEAGSDQRLGWPLSDDLGLVTDALLEEQLELIRARSIKVPGDPLSTCRPQPDASAA